MEDLGATKTLQEVKFGVAWDKLKAKKNFQNKHSENISD